MNWKFSENGEGIVQTHLTLAMATSIKEKNNYRMIGFNSMDSHKKGKWLDNLHKPNQSV